MASGAAAPASASLAAPPPPPAPPPAPPPPRCSGRPYTQSSTISSSLPTKWSLIAPRPATASAASTAIAWHCSRTVLSSPRISATHLSMTGARNGFTSSSSSCAHSPSTAEHACSRTDTRSSISGITASSSTRRYGGMTAFKLSAQLLTHRHAAARTLTDESLRSGSTSGSQSLPNVSSMASRQPSATMPIIVTTAARCLLSFLRRAACSAAIAGSAGTDSSLASPPATTRR
mmetsp:Transcript_28709/g.99065  ORF Transcript_28709/g.99065 Transcript_28709/m.99065 type:complete len:232 (-) Transcript_28709:575-1270(-)